MKSNFSKAFKENFRIKVFVAFAIFIFVISSAFTCFFIHNQSKALTDELIKKGKLLVSILAQNSRIGVFSENNELLKDSVDGIFQQEGVLAVSVFNLEGELLSSKERPEIRASEESVKGDRVRRHKIPEELKESRSPRYLADNGKIEFWSPVTMGSGYSTEEPLFFKEGPLRRKDRIIGFVRITVDKEVANKRLNVLLFKGLLIGIIFLIIGSAITYLMVKGITRPLNRLTEAVKTLGMGGAVEKVPVETEDEIGRLAKAFNYMTESLKARERRLRESQERYRSVFENTGTATMIIEEDMTISMVNTEWEKLSGYSKKEAEGKMKWTEFVYKEDLERMKEYHKKSRGKAGRTFNEYEFRFLDRHGYVKDMLGKTAAIPRTKRRIVSWLDITARKLAEEELRRSEEQLRGLAAHLQSVREEERTTIAGEIHDELGQALTALRMDLAWLGERLPEDQRALVEKTKSMAELTDMTVKTVKRISTGLRPGLLDDLGLVAAIEWQAEEFQNRTGITCSLTIDPKDIVLDEKRSTALFRIFQEALTNVARHADATRVTASLRQKKGILELSMTDNGKGITEEQISDPKSFGLTGMRERIHPLGGQVKVTGVHRKGTAVTVTLPLDEDGEGK
jgi:PAS domain S-box-containing protein